MVGSLYQGVHPRPLYGVCSVSRTPLLRSLPLAFQFLCHISKLHCRPIGRLAPFFLLKFALPRIALFLFPTIFDMQSASRGLSRDASRYRPVAASVATLPHNGVLLRRNYVKGWRRTVHLLYYRPIYLVLSTSYFTRRPTCDHGVCPHVYTTL